MTVRNVPLKMAINWFLDKLEGQVIDKFKNGLGYNAASSTAVESLVNSFEMLENHENNKSRSDKGYHAVPLPFIGNFIPFKPDLTFMDEIAGVKNNGDVVEPKTVRMNSFRPLVIEDWNSDDESKVEFIPNVKDKTVSSSTEKIKFVKSARETVEKGIKREFSVARTPKQNGIAKRKNITLIEAARTMLVDSKLPTTFWAEAINTACYVLNRVLIIKPHNKTPYELISGRPPLIDFMKPFRCPVTILNTMDQLSKFDEKADEGFFVGYSMEMDQTGFFDVDSLTISMNYVPVVAGNQSNDHLLPMIDPCITVNAAEASNAFEEHLFERFSPFKNAFTLHAVSNVTQWKI
ncbi:ribonuclease H-like domain-containing protein [Tanacetum coccineum]